MGKIICAICFFASIFIHIHELNAADKSIPFPKNNPEKAYPDLKIYDSAGHPWRIAREDWEGAKQRIATTPKWAEWLKAEQEELDAWTSKHSDRLEWTCGWYHNFVSPKDGSGIIWENKIPGEEVPFLKSPTDPQIKITQKIMGGWVSAFRTKNIAAILRAARIYRLTGEEKYAKWAIGQIDFYADSYLKWPKSDNTWSPEARMYWQTLDEAVSLADISEAVRLLWNYSKPEQRTRWWTYYFKPQCEALFRSSTFQKIHNHHMWYRSAAAQIAMIYNDKDLWHEAVESPMGVRAQIDQGVTSDYVEWEQSFGYNSYFVSAVSGLFRQAGILGRAEDFKQEMGVIENLMLSTLYIRFPDGQLPLPADVTQMPPVPDRKMFANIYRTFPTSIGLEEAARRYDWNTLLDPPFPSPQKTDLPPVTSRLWESTRMAVLKQDHWQVFFHFGQMTASHAQQEILNFVIYYGNTDISHDPGTVRYGSPLYKDYYKQGLCHNVPLIDGNGMEKIPQYGELISYKPDSITATVSQYRSDTRVTRTLSIANNQFKDTLSVEVQGNASKKIGLPLHLQGKVRLANQWLPDPSFAQGRNVAFSYVKNPKTASFKDSATWIVDYHGQTLEVRISLPGDFQVWHFESLDFPGKTRDCLYVEQSGNKATFVTTLTPLTLKP